MSTPNTIISTFGTVLPYYNMQKVHYSQCTLYIIKANVHNISPPPLATHASCTFYFLNFDTFYHYTSMLCITICGLIYVHCYTHDIHVLILLQNPPLYALTYVLGLGRRLLYHSHPFTLLHYCCFTLFLHY